MPTYIFKEKGKKKVFEKQMKISDAGGLYLLVKSAGKYWKMKYRFAGKEKTLSIGIYPSVSLKEARSKRDAAKKLLEQNIDPSHSKQSDKRKAAAATLAATFKGVANEWLEKKATQWAATTLKHKKADLSNHIFPWMGEMKLIDVEPMDILSICQRIENNGHNEAAHRAKMLCSQILRYGVATGRIKTDPTRDLQGALAPVVTKHRPCLKQPKEVGGLMRAIKEHKGTFIVHAALQLSAYVLLRPVELRKLEWEEIDLEAKTITIPASKMKMKQIHVVPLSNQALAILEEIKPLTGRGMYVFHGARDVNRPMSDAAINAALRHMGYDTKEQHCAHGFRGMASTLLHEQGFNSDHIERQLAHKEGNAIKAAYNHARHLPERTAMMQHYADYLDALRDGAQVIPIGRKA
ncbi:MAG: tyrosine-type recombinase/integrase [Mariprofundus sp.]|nr:tyrosine-type recombinase/integrase [Mariprofundus sp.]